MNDSRASTSTIALEPETATIGSNVTVVSDSAASGGKAVNFGGKIVWKADASAPMEAEWSSLGTHTECAVVTMPGQTSQRFSQVAETNPSPTGRFYRGNILNADNCYNSRAELGQGNPVKTFTDGTGDRIFREGEDRWISFAHRLAPNYPINNTKWALLHQWKQTATYGGPYGNPILSMNAYNGKYRMWGPGYSELNEQNPPTGQFGSWGVDFAMNPSLDSWHLFTMHVKWSPDPSKGYVELFGNLSDGKGWRTLITGRNVATMKINDEGGSGEPIPTYARTGIYRNETYIDNTYLDISGYTVGTTRSTTESNAFRAEFQP